MAQQGMELGRQRLCCSICIDLLQEPATIPCGHSYCMSCIKAYWDSSDGKTSNSCPQCRQTFTQRPALVKNTLLAEVVEDLKGTGLQAAPAGLCYATHQDVACDVCTGRKLKATKSCLQCLVSYCDQHLQPHFESPAFEKHNLVDPSKKLQDSICTRHHEVMKIFCRTDQQCICYLCSMDEHKGHDVVSAAAEATEKQRELNVSQQSIQQKIKERQDDIKMLQQEVETINQSVDRVETSSEKIIAHLIDLVQKKGSDLKQQIRSKQASQVNRLKELQTRLEEELGEMKSRDAELEQLSHTEDHVQFLHRYPPLLNPIQSTNPPSITVHAVRYFDNVLAAVSAVGDKLQDVLSEEWANVMETDEEAVIPSTDPKTRSEFLLYSQQMTLDPNTAHNRLLLSEGNRKVTVTNARQVRPRHPDRFTQKQQVLGTESLTGRHYWEVQMDLDVVKGSVAVTYDISRTQSEGDFGSNDRSWALVLSDSCYKFMHNKSRTSVSGPLSPRIGVFLDHGAGTVSFYGVSDTVTLLHRVRTTFTQPLYAGLGVYGYDSSAELCELT